jgi:hypothetical protein
MQLAEIRETEAPEAYSGQVPGLGPETLKMKLLRPILARFRGWKQPGAARSSQEQPGAAGSSQEQPGAARSSQKQPEVARSSQEQPEAARSSQKQPKAANLWPKAMESRKLPYKWGKSIATSYGIM